MQFHELGDVKLGRLEDLDFSDMHISQGVNAGRGLDNFLSDNFKRELSDEFLEVTLRRISDHDFDHFGANLANLAALGVGGLLDLSVPALCETNGEHSEQVAIGGLDIDVGLNNGLPLSDERAELIAGEIHAVKVSEAGAALNLLALEADLAVGHVLGLLQIGENDLVDAALEGVRRDAGALGAGHERLADLAHVEDGGRLDVVPLLLQKGVHDLLARAFALLGQALVLADGLCLRGRRWGEGGLVDAARREEMGTGTRAGRRRRR